MKPFFSVTCLHVSQFILFLQSNFDVDHLEGEWSTSSSRPIIPQKKKKRISQNKKIDRFLTTNGLERYNDAIHKKCWLFFPSSNASPLQRSMGSMHMNQCHEHYSSHHCYILGKNIDTEKDPEKHSQTNFHFFFFSFLIVIIIIYYFFIQSNQDIT